MSGIQLRHQSSQTVLDIDDHKMNTIHPLIGVDNQAQLMSSWLTGGLAAADYDGDGWIDLFIIGGDLGQSRLYRNERNGIFSDQTANAGLETLNGRIAGAVFADIDNDRDLDLFIGGVLGQKPRLLVQDNSGAVPVFSDTFASAFAGFDSQVSPNTWGGFFGDYNNDGCLDLFMPHSLTPRGPAPARRTAAGSTQHLWQGDCNGTFADVSVSSGIADFFQDEFLPDLGRDQTFAGHFADLNNDGFQDLLIAGDKSTSLILRNTGDGGFVDETERSIIDDFNAMGSSVLDANLDGHLDWFNSNISHLGGWSRGNRLYLGNGMLDKGNVGFINVSDTSGVVSGMWGWSSCAGDFNLDRYPDIFHVTGFYHPRNEHPEVSDGRYDNNPARLFMHQGQAGDVAYTEVSAAAGIADMGEGRGVACFDYDRDGDLDVAISNYNGDFRLYRNDTPVISRFLSIELSANQLNTEGLGTIIQVRPESLPDGDEVVTQVVHAGGHFNSAGPAESHIGLGQWPGPFVIRVQWPGPERPLLEVAAVNAGQHLILPELNDRIYRLGFE